VHRRRDRDNEYLFHRCSLWATSMYLSPTDLDDGRDLTRIRNKNNNATLGTERRYLFADTD
jgi:hypothetical protein